MNSPYIIWLVAKRELVQLKGMRSTWIPLLILIIVWSCIAALDAGSHRNNSATIDTTACYFSLSISLFVSFILASRSFIGEKRERTIETILCGPLTLRQFWLGKVFGICLPALFALALVVGTVYITGAIIGRTDGLPRASVLLFLLVAAPLLIVSFTGLFGFVQLFLGMKENRIVTFAITLVICIIMGSIQYFIDVAGTLTLAAAGLLPGIAIVVILALLGAFRFLRVEKIVTSLE